jgi:hypothetical protein
MHILTSGPEKQAVYFGHAFHLEVKIVPPTLVRLRSRNARSAAEDHVNGTLVEVSADRWEVRVL